jgi:hypothetical protein
VVVPISPDLTELGLQLLTLCADSATGSTGPLLRQLTPAQRVRVMAALVVMIMCGVLLLVLIRAGGRIARWYVNRPPGGARGDTGYRLTTPGDGETRCASENRIPPPADSQS